MKIVKIIFIALLSLVAAVILAWCVLTYLVWPKPELLGLVPGTPLVYVAASGLERNISEAQESEFVERVARSPLWENRKSYRLWKQIREQARAWQKQTRMSINPKGIIQLVGKDAILAFYGEQGQLDFLLISEVSTISRMNIKSGGTEKTLAEVYNITKERYKGAELITLAVPELKLSYGFIGRAGLLSTDVSLLKKCVDLHKGIDQGMAARSEFKELAAGLPESDISFHVNASKIRDATDHRLISTLIAKAKAEPLLGYLGPIAQHINACVVAGFYQNGDLALDLRVNHNLVAASGNGDASIYHSTDLVDLSNRELPVPVDCLFFGLYEMLESSVLFDIVETAMSIDLDAARDGLPPVLHSGAAMVVLKPNIKELQVLPPVMIFFQVKDKAAAKTVLEDLSGSMKARGRQLEFTETKYANASIKRTRIPIGMGMSLDAGYTFIGDDLLVVATDISALEAAVDVSVSKQPSLMKDKRYASVLAPIAEGAEGRIFVDITSTAEITRQAGKLYAWRAKIAGEREVEQIATLLYENIFTLEAWRYMGMAFESEDDRASVRMILSKH